MPDAWVHDLQSKLPRQIIAECSSRPSWGWIARRLRPPVTQREIRLRWRECRNRLCARRCSTSHVVRICTPAWRGIPLPAWRRSVAPSRRRIVVREFSRDMRMPCFSTKRNEIGRCVTRQRRLGKMRVGGDEVFRTTMEIGEVAAPAAGDQDLFADAPGPLQHGHAAARACRLQWRTSGQPHRRPE